MSTKTTFDVMVDAMLKRWLPGASINAPFREHLEGALRDALTVAGTARALDILVQKDSPKKATVILFKDSGRYYTEEEWEIPADAIGPHDMKRSKDFRRIEGGSVVIPTQEPWGYPYVIIPEMMED
jgi:hypothetical protein